jgi:hypothetical protein
MRTASKARKKIFCAQFPPYAFALYRSHRQRTMPVCSARLRAVPLLRGKPPSLLFCACQTRLPLRSFVSSAAKLILQPTAFDSRRALSTDTPTMTAHKIDGTAIARAIREKINAEIQERQRSNPRYKPSLVIIQGILACNWDFAWAC